MADNESSVLVDLEGLTYYTGKQDLKNNNKFLQKSKVGTGLTVDSNGNLNATGQAYTSMTSAEATAGTETGDRVVSPKVLSDFVTEKVSDVVGAAPAALDTLKELGDALGNDANFASTVTTQIAGKMDKTQVATASVIGGVKSSGDDLDVVVRPNGTMYVKVASNAAAHNGIYRGKDLTSYFDSGAMSTAIANGTFDDIYIGDYIIKTINLPAINYTDKAGTEKTQAAQTFSNVKWYIAGIDSHLKAGDTQTTAHHVVLISANALQRNVSMNPTNDTTGGYIGSDMWRIHMPNWSAAIKAAFGESHVLKYGEILSNTLNATAASAAGGGWMGTTTSWAWTDVEVNIPNETMICGGHPHSSSRHDVGDWPQQLPLFAHKQYIGGDDRSWFWLRAVASASYFALADGYGAASARGASFAHAGGGIRPYFLLR